MPLTTLADVAEAYRIGYMRAFTMPWTKTRDFPHALLSGPTDSLESFNIASYGLFDSLVWRASSGMINKFRKRIGLQATDLESLHTSRVPFIYVRPDMSPHRTDQRRTSALPSCRDRASSHARHCLMRPVSIGLT